VRFPPRCAGEEVSAHGSEQNYLIAATIDEDLSKLVRRLSSTYALEVGWTLYSIQDEARGDASDEVRFVGKWHLAGRSQGIGLNISGHVRA